MSPKALARMKLCDGRKKGNVEGQGNVGVGGCYSAWGEVLEVLLGDYI